VNGDPSVMRSRCNVDMQGGVRRRVLKTHVAYHDIPKGGGRYIYVARDGKDVAVSYYYHYRRSGYGRTFREFYEQFTAGAVRFGKWRDHVAAWESNHAQLNILFLKYEDLIENLEAAVRSIASFCDISFSETDLRRVLDRCSFEFMRAHEVQLDPKMRRKGEVDPASEHFIRKGGRGDWMSHFDHSLLRHYKCDLEQHIKQSCLLKHYLGGGPLPEDPQSSRVASQANITAVGCSEREAVRSPSSPRGGNEE
jgi:hypothetical protein